MVAPLNLSSSLTNVLNTGVSAAGTVAQSANTLTGNSTLQNSILSGTGDSASVAAQMKASQEQDANGAKLIAMQSEETKRKQTTDVLNAIEAGKEDSTNKKISATAQNAKGISY